MSRPLLTRSCRPLHTVPDKFDEVAAHYAAKTLENVFTVSLNAPNGSVQHSLGSSVPDRAAAPGGLELSVRGALATAAVSASPPPAAPRLRADAHARA